MLAYPLYIALLWHMHQPYYKESVSGQHILPWARLHGTKDYLHMAQVISQYPNVHITVNLVPALVEQLVAYSNGTAVDKLLSLSLQDTWTSDEKQYLLSNCFSIHWDNIIRRYPRYWELLEKRQSNLDNARAFSHQDLRDLVAWFNLAWIDPNLLETDPLLQRMVDKGRDYSRSDLHAILTKHQAIIAEILPLYRELEDKGQIETSTSPQYHPIIPLVMNIEYAQRPNPHLSLPDVAFAHPEDASEQIRRAIETHELHLGRRPKGLWPSEGAVCPEIVFRLAEEGFTWFATDEAILAHSQEQGVFRDDYGHVTNPHLLYQPYRTHVGDQPPSVLFRDRLLSDRIGFVYKDWQGEDAAADLVHRLYRIRESLNDTEHPHVVTIILDGENCWEQYEHNGDVFLHALYRELSETRELEAVTVSQYLSEHAPRIQVPSLYTGSWINHSLETWIGEPEQNLAWEYLARTRDRLISWQREYAPVDFEILERAWEAIYIAEGSDWFWWYYSHNDSDQDRLFDETFRGHLASVYAALGLPVPSWLNIPIVGPDRSQLAQAPSAYIDPHLVAGPVPTLEWSRAGHVYNSSSSGTMQRGFQNLKRLCYGYNPAELFVRIEVQESLTPYRLALYLSGSHNMRANHLVRYASTQPGLVDTSSSWEWEVLITPDHNQAWLFSAEGQEVWRRTSRVNRVVMGSKVVEVALPLRSLNLHVGCNVELQVTLIQGSQLVEALPRGAPLAFSIRPMT